MHWDSNYLIIFSYIDSWYPEYFFALERKVQIMAQQDIIQFMDQPLETNVTVGVFHNYVLHGSEMLAVGMTRFSSYPRCRV